MKVVINKCYGGFGISIEALKELVKRKANCIETFTPKHYYGGDNEAFKGRDWEKSWAKDFESFKDIGDGMKADHDRSYNIYHEGLLYSLKSRSDNEMRTDKDLVEVVEAIGEKVNTRFSELKIVEVPDNIIWEIDEYDGIETIHQTHEVWS